MDVTPRHATCPFRPRLLARWLHGATVLSALLAVALAGCAQQTRWYPDYPQGERVAQSQNRPMLLFFWDWLSRDQARIDLQVFPDPRVTAAMRRTVNVRLEAGWFRDLARQYDVRQTPTFILADPSGVEQSRLTGVPAPQEFVAWLEEALGQGSATQPVDAATGPVAAPPADTPVPPAPPATQPTP